MRFTENPSNISTTSDSCNRDLLGYSFFPITGCIVSVIQQAHISFEETPVSVYHYNIQVIQLGIKCSLTEKHCQVDLFSVFCGNYRILCSHSAARSANAPRQDPPVSLRFAPANMRIETDVHGAQASLVSAATAHPRGIIRNVLIKGIV